jgi:hypothetical protein
VEESAQHMEPMVGAVTRQVCRTLVIQLSEQPVFLGGFVSRVPMDFKHATSGWTLNGPGQYDQTGRGHVLR